MNVNLLELQTIMLSTLQSIPTESVNLIISSLINIQTGRDIVTGWSLEPIMAILVAIATVVMVKMMSMSSKFGGGGVTHGLSKITWCPYQDRDVGVFTSMCLLHLKCCVRNRYPFT